MPASFLAEGAQKHAKAEEERSNKEERKFKKKKEKRRLKRKIWKVNEVLTLG